MGHELPLSQYPDYYKFNSKVVTNQVTMLENGMDDLGEITHEEASEVINRFLAQLKTALEASSADVGTGLASSAEKVLQDEKESAETGQVPAPLLLQRCLPFWRVLLSSVIQDPAYCSDRLRSLLGHQDLS